jgi:hypothetical protein
MEILIFEYLFANAKVLIGVVRHSHSCRLFMQAKSYQPTAFFQRVKAAIGLTSFHSLQTKISKHLFDIASYRLNPISRQRSSNE